MPLTFLAGVFVGDIAGAEPPTLEDLLLCQGDSTTPLESLSPIARSELLRDLA